MVVNQYGTTGIVNSDNIVLTLGCKTLKYPALGQDGDLTMWSVYS
jgi:hypothetical protein